MALFSSSVLKQRFLVPRFPSAVVYYVHSHLQYTASACKVEAHNELVSITHKCSKPDGQNLDTRQLRHDNYSNLLTSNPRKRSEQSRNVFLHKMSGDPFITHTHLALMSLSYDEKWCQSFKIVYQQALKSRRSLLGDSSEHSATLDEISDAFKKQTDNYNAAIIKEQAPALDTVMFTRYCQETSKQSDKKIQNEDKCDPLKLSTVYASLREELPLFFCKCISYELYHKRVKFINGLTGTTFSGLRSYRTVLSTMRIAAQLCLTDVKMDILKITKDSKECNVKVRWRVSGVPRFGIFNSRTKQEGDNCRYVDGFSIFEVGQDGLIHCHRLLKLMPNSSHESDINPLWALNSVAVMNLLRQQKSFEMLARHRVDDIKDTVSLVGAN